MKRIIAIVLCLALISSLPIALPLSMALDEDYEALEFPSPYTLQYPGKTLEEISALKLNNPQEIADPSMIYYDGAYYVYSTNGAGVSVLRSTDDLASFEGLGLALKSPLTSNSDPYMFWAPDVYYEDGVFYMYYSCATVGNTDAFQQTLKVATSTDPLGPFIYQKDLAPNGTSNNTRLDRYVDEADRLYGTRAPQNPNWAIDAHMVKRDGKYYLFFAAKGWGKMSTNNGYGTNANQYYGTMIFMQEFIDPLTPRSGTRRLAVDPTVAQERYNNTGNDYCLEGAYYFERDGVGYLMYSGNAWASNNYFIGYATWDLQGDLIDADFAKYPTRSTWSPLLNEDSNAKGMGHHSICIPPEGPYAGKILMAHHGYAVDTTGLMVTKAQARLLYITEVTVDDVDANKLIAHRRWENTVRPNPPPYPDPPDPGQVYPQVFFEASDTVEPISWRWPWGHIYFTNYQSYQEYCGEGLPQYRFYYTNLIPGTFFDIYYTGSWQSLGLDYNWAWDSSASAFLQPEIIRAPSGSVPGIARFTYARLVAKKGNSNWSDLSVIGFWLQIGSNIYKIVHDSETYDDGALRALIAEADELEETDYTPETWSGLAAPLADAKVVAAFDKAGQKRVDDAAAALQAAVDALDTVVPANTALIYVTGPASAVSGAEPGSRAEVTYTISAKFAPVITGIELEFEVDGDYLSSKDFAALSGFEIFGNGNYGTDIYWRNEGNKWIGKVTLLDLAALSGGAQPPISGDIGIMDLTFYVIDGVLGPSTVKLNYIKPSSMNGPVNYIIISDSVTTVFEKYYSPYDLNKDGVVDINDLTFALVYLTVREGDPDWDDVKYMDFDDSKEIDIGDLILIFANYTIPYYG